MEGGESGGWEAEAGAEEAEEESAEGVGVGDVGGKEGAVGG